MRKKAKTTPKLITSQDWFCYPLIHLIKRARENTELTEMVFATEQYISVTEQ